MGRLDPGCRAEAEFRVENLAGDALFLKEIASSCPCVEVEPGAIEVASGGAVTLKATFDPSVEPEFRGSLGVRLVGRDRADREVFRVEVQVSVEGPPGREADTRSTPKGGAR